MSFEEVRRGAEPIHAITFSQLGKKIAEDEALKAEIAAWVESGGNIKTAGHGEVALDFAAMPALINEFSGKIDRDRIAKVSNQKTKKDIETELATFNTSKVRAKNKSPWGQNIKKTSSGKLQVSIANFHGTFDTNPEAREARDYRRKVMGMPPAEY